MKTTKAPLLVLLLTCSLLAAPDLRAADADREADHAALRQLRDKAVTAINNLDAEALASCFAEEFAFTTVNQTTITNRAQFQAFFNQTFRAPDALITALKTEATADILTRFLDDNTGVCYGSSQDTYTLKNGDMVAMNNRWSATVVKENGEWKAALAHIGTDFMHNPVLDRAAAAAKKLAIGVGIGGLVLGFVLGRLAGGGKKAGA